MLLGFSLILLPGMFISCYTIIYCFVKNFFSNVYISVNRMFKCSYLSFDWEIGHPLNMYITRGMEGVSFKMFTDAHRGKGVSRFMCTNALTLSLFMFLSYSVFLSYGFCLMVFVFFYFTFLFRTKVSQNGFNFSQIES